jgi:uncharacterized protein YggE
MSGMDHVTTTGSGSAAATPDAMRVSVAVTVTAPTVAEALAGVADGARSSGEVARRHTDENRVSTGGFSAQPDHDQRGRPDGFRASHELHVTCGLTDAGQLVTDLAEAVGDLLRVHGVQPVVTDTASQMDRARELAFADARTKASQLAGLAGRTLGPALRISEGRRPESGWAAPATRSLSASSMDFEAGSVDVTAAVTVRWALLG